MTDSQCDELTPSLQRVTAVVTIMGLGQLLEFKSWDGLEELENTVGWYAIAWNRFKSMICGKNHCIEKPGDTGLSSLTKWDSSDTDIYIKARRAGLFGFMNGFRLYAASASRTRSRR